MEPDQGLRYELAAAIGAREVLERLALALQDVPVVPLPTDALGLLPVTPELAGRATPAALCALGLPEIPGGTAHAEYRRNRMLTGPESGFEVLTPGLVSLVEAVSTVGPLAYVEADYLARDGRQAAAVWRSGRLVTGPLLLGRNEPFPGDGAPIAVALHGIGVRAAGRRDEFLVAGLDRHRRTAQWWTDTGGTR